jgi:hypothetical protein
MGITAGTAFHPLLCTRASFHNRDPIWPDWYHENAHAFSAASHESPCGLSHLPLSIAFVIVIFISKSGSGLKNKFADRF